MKRKIQSLLLVTIAMMAWASCKEDDDDDAIAVASISLDITTKTLSPGEEFDLTATITPSNAVNKDVDWSTSDANVATVDADGHVVAVAKGSATITVKTNDGGKTETCAVVVITRVTGITLNTTAMKLYIDEDATLIAMVTPNDADNKEVEWSSDNEDVATIEDGYVRALSAGTATLSATTVDGEKTATCTLTVAGQYIFDDVSKEIRTTVYGDYPSGYQFWLFPTVEDDGIFQGADEYILVDIAQERMGTPFTLTEENPNNYDLDWRVTYRNHKANRIYEGFGYEDAMGDVKSGTLYAMITGEDTFEVTIDVLFTDNKRFAGTYKGKFVKNNEFYGENGRRAPGRGSNL
ncbi:Ig-like domain-containing protein [Fulvivirgaceae bacterium PWU5]|uniref:Ig-like domain-containing protein n=1 Tax=Dawidia cretensis TaxID=2782350 RepID=A0AAP2E564_9BACT|nr:Ig-like domain-containing protein [Dawidia cretensis]MBT1712157.1 Ig-like domain-containing protein [Dawidia cretensis]